MQKVRNHLVLMKRAGGRLLPWLMLMLGGLPALAQSPSVFAQSPSVKITPGAAVETVERAGPRGEDITIWTYRPAGLRPTDRIIFVMHGVGRNADVYRDNWIRHAQEHRFLLVVPEMSQEIFPGDAGYNFGGMVDRQRNAQPMERWSWPVIERVFDAVRSGVNSKRETYSIFGHSAGAQFVHRFGMFAQDTRADAVIAANAGWYTLPVFTEPFPYGLKGAPIDEARVKANLSKPMVILLGDKDVDPHHPSLRRDEASDRQGTTRFARGQFFMKTAEVEARRLSVPFGWKMEVVPGVAHDNDKMGDAAIRWLFPKS